MTPGEGDRAPKEGGIGRVDRAPGEGGSWGGWDREGG